MASVAVTGVTPVTSGKCHACHAPRGRDICRDTRNPPLTGGSRCHACHAGLSFEGRGFERDIFRGHQQAGSHLCRPRLLAASDGTLLLPRWARDDARRVPHILCGLWSAIRGEGPRRLGQGIEPTLLATPPSWHPRLDLPATSQGVAR